MGLIELIERLRAFRDVHPSREPSTHMKLLTEAASALESLQAENQALRSQVEELGGDPGHTLDSQIIDLRDENAALREKVAELEAKIKYLQVNKP